ncbi:MAG: Ppx/GppA family phosphatase [Deltaproteobacteria bacterium]|nr:MAG: Ppx/GppA family phosphatase [Deltaproteobacteria bacterium]
MDTAPARAAIDIGSNSILLLVRAADGRTLHDEARVVGLGQGLGDRGLFRPDRMDAAVAVLGDYVARCGELGVPVEDIAAVATSAARRALNARSFLDRVRAETGLAVRIISGEEEARLTWLGALDGLELAPGRTAVVDLGGGSTEVVIGEGARIGFRTSLELGSVRQTEAFFGNRPDRVDPRDLGRLRQVIEGDLQALREVPRPRSVVAVAGTATTLAAMQLGLVQWDRDRVHGSRLTRSDLRRFIDRLLASSREQRRAAAAVAPERADFLLAGACILEAVLGALHRESMVVSDGGVRQGLLVD